MRLSLHTNLQKPQNDVVLDRGTVLVTGIALRLNFGPALRKEKFCGSLVLLFCCCNECTLAVAYTLLTQPSFLNFPIKISII